MRASSIRRTGWILGLALACVLAWPRAATATGDPGDEVRNARASGGESRSYEMDHRTAFEMATRLPGYEIAQGPVRFEVRAPMVRYRHPGRWTFVWRLVARASAPGSGPMIEGRGGLIFDYANGRLTVSSSFRLRAGYAPVNWAASYGSVDLEFVLQGGLELRTYVSFWPTFRFGYVEVGPYGQADLVIDVPGPVEVRARAYVGTGLGFRADDVPGVLLVDLYLHYLTRAYVRTWFVRTGGRRAGYVRRVVTRARIDGLAPDGDRNPIDEVAPGGPDSSGSGYGR